MKKEMGREKQERGREEIEEARTRGGRKREMVKE